MVEKISNVQWEENVVDSESWDPGFQIPRMVEKSGNGTRTRKEMGRIRKPVSYIIVGACVGVGRLWNNQETREPIYFKTNLNLDTDEDGSGYVD